MKSENIESSLIKSFTEKVKKITPIVAKVLRTHLDSRDEDTVLTALVWQQQGANDDMSFLKFKVGLINGKFATPETITRSRRKLQEKHIEYRGALYEQRKKAEKIVANQIVMEFEN